jgi:hypothetical protein
MSEHLGAPAPTFQDLHHALCARYNLEELRTLCAEIGVPFDDLGGEGRSGKVRELILWLQRRDRLDALLAYLLAEPPHRTARAIHWHPQDDVAVLELACDPPAGARPAPLVEGGDLLDHPFRAFGFPPGRTT